MRVSARIVRVQLAETFVIAREAADWADVVQVEVAHGEVVGRGEAAPIERYAESAESALAFVEAHGALLGDDPFALEEIGARLAAVPGRAGREGRARRCAPRPAGQAARRAGLAAARAAARSGRRRRGRCGSAIPTTWRAAREAAAPRFRRLKLKLGGGDGLDVERVRAVRGVTDLPLMVDVNEWWSLDEALDACDELAALGVEYVEQPLPAGDPGGAELRRRSPLPVYVDEDCHTLADVAACAEIAHGVNIKLAKSGGIREAIRMAHAARALGLGVMLGCMVESGLGIAAGCVVAPLCDHVDLDGNLLLAERSRARVSPSSTGCRCPPTHRDSGLGAWSGEGRPDADPRRGLLGGPALRQDACAGCCATGATTSSRSSTRRARARPTTASRSSADVEGALAFGPTVALVGVATQGGRFPAGVARAAARVPAGAGSRSRTGCTSCSATTPSCARSPGGTASSCATSAVPPADLDCPTGANLERRRSRSCSPSARTARSGR